ncbi:MAG: hypothetical protein HYX89_08080 [Chloroflexi bacterium]|nr:hypothetical protein [Chloroflexota bacterium]
MDRAGNPGGLGPQEFFAIKVILAASLGTLVFLLVNLGFDLMFPVELGFAVVMVVLGYRLPDFWIDTRASARQSEISSALADTVDLLSFGVSAGLSFDGAIRRICQK